MPTPAERLKQAFPALAGDSELMRELQQLGRTATLPAHQSICKERAGCDHLAFVLSGQARVYKMGETGREITLYRLNRGDCCILTLSCILSRRAFPAWATTESPLEALLVPGTAIRRWMERYPLWRHYAWQLVADRLGDIISLVEEITFRRMDQRLEQLLARRDRFPPGQRVAVTHRELATELGTSCEVVTRLLRDLEQKGRVETGRGWLRIPTGF